MEQIEKHNDTKPKEPHPAPGRPGSRPLWNTGHKTAVGTSLSNRSRVWFTIAHGYINEIYFPDVDKANTRFVRLLVSDGGTFLSDEDGDADHEVRGMHPGVPAFRVATRCKHGKYCIEKEIIADPDRDCVVMQLRFEAAPDAGNLHLYVFADPHLKDEGEDNDAWVGACKGIPMLFAQRRDRAMAIACSQPFKHLSCGYMGVFT